MPSKAKQYVMDAPNSEPQRKLFKSRSKYTLYGGARGGGKSWSARNKAPLLAFRYPGIRILILRRTFPQLEQNYILPMRAQLNGFAKYTAAARAFSFANGSYIKFGYCDSEGDTDQYQGHEYDVIFMDEATQFTHTMFVKFTACLRGVNHFPKRMYLFGNPGGVGHAWVKRLFISRQYEAGERAEDYLFIPARVYDNTSLMSVDPAYVENLERLPEDLRRAWLDGDWDVFIGQFFSEWRREVHVVKPFVLQGSWRYYVCLDYGLDMLAAYVVAIDTEGWAFVVSEVFEGRENGQGENGAGLLVNQAAKRVRQMVAGRKIDAYFAPPDLWNRRQDTGRSAAEVFAAEGVPLVRVSNNRRQGWLELKEWLQAKVVPDWPWACPKPAALPGGGYKAARLRVFDSCPSLIESLPGLVYSEKDPNDCATEPHKYTHGPDALRYLVAGRPMAAPGGAGTEEEDAATYDEQAAGLLAYGI